MGQFLWAAQSKQALADFPSEPSFMGRHLRQTAFQQGDATSLENSCAFNSRARWRLSASWSGGSCKICAGQDPEGMLWIVEATRHAT